MPSVLVELGFISNPTEEAFLLSEEGQVYMASAIYRAFKEFKLEYERENALPPQLTAEQRAILAPGVPVEKTPATKTPVSKPKTHQVIYRVQFLTSPRELAATDQRLKNISELFFYEHNGLRKYTSGAFESQQAAQRHQAAMKQKGFKDAFVVAFYQDKRISNEEALKLMNP